MLRLEHRRLRGNTVKFTIGAFNQRWIVHPRKHGDLILTSQAAIAIVDTRNKYAVVGTTLKALQNYEQRDLIRLRQDVVDRLLDAESSTKASTLPAHAIDLSGLGVRVAACDPSSSLATA